MPAANKGDSALCGATCALAGDEKPEGCSSPTAASAPSSCPSAASEQWCVCQTIACLRAADGSLGD